MKDIHKQTYYELLEVAPSASPEEILKAYNRARATYSNNSPALYSLFNKEEAQELLKLIDEAYAVLSNQFRRKQYDKNAFKSAESKSDSEPESESGSKPAEVAQNPQPIPETNQSPPVKKTTPDGLGSTRFGKYRIDAEMEQMIEQTHEFTGATLEKIRLYKNITLDQISDYTKVSRAYLLAIEANDYSCLPATVFVRGFLVQLAKILSLDANKVSISYLQQMKGGGKT